MRTESLILKAILYFNVVTLILYIITPFSINSGYHFVNILYIAFNIYMMSKGFASGERHRNRIYQANSMVSIKPKLFTIMLFFYLCTFLLRYAYMLYLPPFDVGLLINRIAIGISDPYIGRTITHGSRTLPWTIFFLTSIIDSVFFIIAIISWSGIKRWCRILVITLMLIDALYWMGSGTNFGVIMLLLSSLLAMLIQIKEDVLSKASVIKYISWCMVALFLALFIFNYNMEGRSGGDFENLSGDSYLALGTSVKVDEQHPLLAFLPYRLQVLVLFIFSYVTQGYMFFEYMFSLDFHWGCFFGNNPALQSIAQDFLGFNPAINSYQDQMEKLGVDSYVNWHSCYLWLANDFTLVGVPFVVFYIGKLTSSALYMFRRTKDILSGVMFIIFANMLFFMFANNNWISTVFYSFMFIFPYWYFTRYKKV